MTNVSRKILLACSLKGLLKHDLQQAYEGGARDATASPMLTETDSLGNFH